MEVSVPVDPANQLGLIRARIDDRDIQPVFAVLRVFGEEREDILIVQGSRVIAVRPPILQGIGLGVEPDVSSNGSSACRRIGQ